MIDFIDIHTHQLRNEENTFSLYNLSLPFKEIPAKMYFSAGWHPWDIGAYSLNQIESSLKEISAQENVIALGECGLDRSIKTPNDTQVKIFRTHINLAKEHNKPLIIHCVRAYSDLLEILKNEKFEGKFVLHNFIGNKYQIDSFLKFNAYFSFGKQLTKPNLKLIDSLKDIPIERVFVETDDSEFNISEMYYRASDLMQIPVEVLKTQIKQNFTLLFKGSLVE